MPPTPVTNFQPPTSSHQPPTETKWFHTPHVWGFLEKHHQLWGSLTCLYQDLSDAKAQFRSQNASLTTGPKLPDVTETLLNEVMTITQGNIQIYEVAEFVAIFNRGYQPLALLEEVPPLIYRSAFLAPKIDHRGVAKHLVVLLATSKFVKGQNLWQYLKENTSL